MLLFGLLTYSLRSCFAWWTRLGNRSYSNVRLKANTSTMNRLNRLKCSGRFVLRKIFLFHNHHLQSMGLIDKYKFHRNKCSRIWIVIRVWLYNSHRYWSSIKKVQQKFKFYQYLRLRRFIVRIMLLPYINRIRSWMKWLLLKMKELVSKR